jgi:SAM-dependent methyltransferase
MPRPLVTAAARSPIYPRTVFTRVLCPLCERTARRFRPLGGGAIKRPNAQCPHCGSLERHRLIWLYLRDETDLFSGTEPKRMLHVAPEPALRARLAGDGLIDYLSADLDPGLADVQMDITAIDFPADSFDVIYCSHVFEHVPDDALAMRELCRVLRPTGWAILQVPILLERTEEDPSLTDPEERLRRFAQRDHVRAYGPDYADRLRAAGFEVRLDRYAERLGAERARRYGVLTEEIVHLCTKI